MANESNEKDWAAPTLKEAPFWREGMTPEEYEEERTYLIQNWDLWMNLKYTPLWKQRGQKQTVE